jgi:DNA-binding transcriptional LysR family regulator
VLLAELRNFRMTAERLFTTQAAVSSRIATLEQEFGVRLFDRGVREVTLTADGAKALVHAERMLRLMREMREDMLDKQAYAGVIRIGAIESIVHSWFPDFLALLQQRYPRLQVEIACDTTIHMSEQLLKGQLDVSLQAKPVRRCHRQSVAGRVRHGLGGQPQAGHRRRDPEPGRAGGFSHHELCARLRSRMR